MGQELTNELYRRTLQDNNNNKELQEEYSTLNKHIKKQRLIGRTLAGRKNVNKVINRKGG